MQKIDSVQLQAGARDFIFVCKKQPFALTCSPYMPKINDTYIDMDLVLKLNLPMKNLQCTRLTFAEQFTRIVGQVNQTVQCVVAGKAMGSYHIKAKVVRDLNKLFHADCLPSQKLYDKLWDTTTNLTHSYSQPDVPVATDPSPRSTLRELKAGDGPVAIRTPVKDRQTQHRSLNEINTGTKDVYTNISTIIENDHMDSVSDTSRGDDVTQFLASLTQDERNQAVSDYPELAPHCQVSKDYDESLGYYGSMRNTMGHSSNLMSQAVSGTEQATVGSILDPAPPLFLPSNQPLQNAPELSQVSQISDQSYPYDYSDLGAPQHDVRPQHGACHDDQGTADDDAKLAAQFGYGPNTPFPDDEYELAAKFGYGPNKPFPDDDQNTEDDEELAAKFGYGPDEPCDISDGYDSDTADFFCRLCHVSGQLPSITFNHNLMDPKCPSTYNEEGD